MGSPAPFRQFLDAQLSGLSFTVILTPSSADSCRSIPKIPDPRCAEDILFMLYPEAPLGMLPGTENDM